MEQLNSIYYVLFGASVFAAITLLYLASKKNNYVLGIIASIGIIQSLISSTDFYADASSIPPRFVFLVLPSFLFVILSLSIPKFRSMCTRFDMKFLILIHAVRLLVELVLHALYEIKFIPKVMTYEGNNFDILIGITAIIIYYLYRNGKLSSKAFLIWNYIGLIFLINIVLTAIISAPGPQQLIAFDQPNKAVQHFPFSLLPAIIVPIVFFSHILSIIKLKSSK